MGLFETKKEKLRPGCCAGTGGAERTGAPEAVTGVKVLGSGCAKCNALEQAVRAALSDYYTRQGIDPEPIVGKLKDVDHDAEEGGSCSCG